MATPSIVVDELLDRDVPAALKLALSAAPIPADWVARNEAWPQLNGFRKVDGLAIPPIDSAWLARCETRPELPWMLWTALRALGADRLRGHQDPVASVRPGVASGVIAQVDFRPLGIDHVALVGDRGGLPAAPAGVTPYRLRRGHAGAGVLTPGPTLDERLFGDQVLEEGFRFTRALLDCALADVIEAEYETARRWLSKDRVLGLTVLLGPLTPKLVGRNLALRRDSGYLDEKWGLTDAGWWRLAYLSQQGVGLIEDRRWAWLRQTYERIDARTGRPGRRRHTFLIQKLVLQLMKSEGLVPLGVEYSATAKLIAEKAAHTMKADALMIRPSNGNLVWVELLRRNERELSWRSDVNVMRRQPGDRYKRMREVVLPWLADVLDQEVELYVKEPSGLRHMVFSPGSAPASAPVLSVAPLDEPQLDEVGEELDHAGSIDDSPGYPDYEEDEDTWE